MGDTLPELPALGVIFVGVPKLIYGAAGVGVGRRGAGPGTNSQKSVPLYNY